MSWKCLFSIMSLKSRRFSLDSALCQDVVGLHGGRSGSSRFSSRKSGKSQSLDDARMQIQELNRSLSCNESRREQAIAEVIPERPDGLVNNNSIVKHNKTFHKQFEEIPEWENLTHALPDAKCSTVNEELKHFTFTCALQKEVLYHGKLFVSENHVCFYSSVLLKDTKVVIPASSVMEVKKHNSALSMLSIQTADGEKCSFVSLRNREMCYKLLQSVCSHAQAASSPHLSEADHDVASSYSSLEDSVDHDLSRRSSIYLENHFPQMSSEGPTRCNSTRQNSLVDEDDRATPWIWRITESVAPFFILREMRNLSLLFYIYMMLMVLLLLASGYIGLKIMALEEQLTSLGALTELSLPHREYQET